MLREERIGRIAQTLMQEQKVLSHQLADEFGLTLASVRRDLMELERRGVAKRVYGGAVLAESGLATLGLSLGEPRLVERLGAQHLEKEAIGRMVATLIRDGETVMIDGGTTTLQVCRHLVDKHNLSIISCALNNVWPELVSKPGLQVFLTGGFLRAESLSLVGEVAENMLRGFLANKAILGMDGISLERGFTAINFLEASIKKRMIEVSQELIVVADHTKFGKVCPIAVAPLERASKVVTDAGTPPEFIRSLEKCGVEAIVAELETTHMVEHRISG